MRNILRKVSRYFYVSFFPFHVFTISFAISKVPSGVYIFFKKYIYINEEIVKRHIFTAVEYGCERQYSIALFEPENLLTGLSHPPT